MSNAYIEGHVKTSKPGRRYSRANGRQVANLSIHNYVYNSIPADWPVAAGDCVEWIDAHGEILQGTVRGAKNINGVPHVTVKMAGGKVKPAALDAIKVAPAPDGKLSNGYHLIDVSKVWASHPRRAVNAEKVEALKQSIEEVGLIHPIAIRSDYSLIGGMHRLQAFRELGREIIPAVVHAMSDIDAEIAEIDENLARNEGSHLERSQSLARRKELYLLKHPETAHGGDRGNQHTGGKRQNAKSAFSQDAAEKTGRSRRAVEEDVQIAENILPEVQEVIAETVLAESKSDLLTLARIAPEKQLEAAHALITMHWHDDKTTAKYRSQVLTTLVKLPNEDLNMAAGLCGDYPQKAEILLRLYQSMQRSPSSNETYREIIATGGFHYGEDMKQWCDFRSTNSANDINSALLSVSEYHRNEYLKNKQVEKEQRRQDKAAAKAAIPEDLPLVTDRYQLIEGDFRTHLQDMAADSIDAIITDPPYPKEYLPLYGDLARLSAHVLKPGGSLLVMIGQSYLPDILQLMCPHMTYHWTLSYLTPGGQATQLWQRNVNTFWKPVLWFVKGDYEGDWQGDVLKSSVNDNDKRFHHWGQSESGMADIVERFTYPGQTILDPFVGGGTTGVVAIKMNRLFVGVDCDPKAISTSKERLSQCK